MAAPNRNTLWGRAIAEELAAAGIGAAVVAPGSRSTPLTVALAGHDEITVNSHLDERSAAYFALGRGRATGAPTPLVCTSGTAAANVHPAVIEAHQSRVPMVVLTADRPPALRDSGANQTIDQRALYGDAVRWHQTLPEPEPTGRKLRSVRVTVARAVAAATGTPPGPVHLNVPARKPLEPTPVPGDVPADVADRMPLGAVGRDGAFVSTTTQTATVDRAACRRLARVLEATDRGLIVTGPANQPTPSRDALAAVTKATGFPVLADPLSGHRFGHAETLVCGGYDAYLESPEWPEPAVVLRFGASPTSKTLRTFLKRTDARQYLVDPAGEWREASFTATDLIAADPDWLSTQLADLCASPGGRSEWQARLAAAEQTHWETVGENTDYFEGTVAATVAETIPPDGTLMVSNSMPVRDLDRFGRPRAAPVRVFGNRGASGIDGITSTAFGLESATDGPVVLLIGDLAFYHDLNGLLAAGRFGLDPTIVLVNNDGGGIFHLLPIASFDPPFTEHFRTPHGLDFAPAGELYNLQFDRVVGLATLRERLETAIETPGAHVIEAVVDGERSHRVREQLQADLLARIDP